MDSGDAIYSEADDFTITKNSCYVQTTNGTTASAMTEFEKISSGKLQTTRNVKNSKHAVALVILYFIVTALLLALVGACIAFTFKISNIKSGAGQIENSVLNYTVHELGVQMNQSFSDTNSNIQLLNVLIENVIESAVVPSCAVLPPSSPSGYYWVRASNGSAVRVYCDKTRSCDGVTGGWMRVAELNMTNSSQVCPSSFRQRTDSNMRTCELMSSDYCSSVDFHIPSLEYSRVCGRILAYQVGSTDAFGIQANNADVRPFRATIEQNYVDGISLTHGHPRQHIWTFVAALDEVVTFRTSNCPCTGGIQAPAAAYVGNDYFCDTASTGNFTNSLFYGDDPLWDGAGCGPQNTCCSFNNPPWFYKQLPQPTTDDIEMRVCRDEKASNNENIAIEIIEIYVQ